MLYKMIYFSSHKFAFSNLRFSPFYEHFRQLREKYAFKLKNKVHHVNQLIEADLMMCIHMTFSKKTTPLHSTHSTELFKILLSLLTLFTAFLQKASGPGKNVYLYVEEVKLTGGDIIKYLNMLDNKFTKKINFMENHTLIFNRKLKEINKI